MIENFEDQYISDTYGLVVQYESGSFYDGFGNFIQNVGSGSSNTDTGSFVTTSSFNSFTSSINAYTQSINNTTSSFILNSQTSSMSVLSASFATTASFALNAGGSTIDTGSLATTASLNSYTASLNAFSASILNYTSSQNILNNTFATTGSNIFIGNQTITGSLTLSSSAATELNVVGNSVFTGSATVSIPYPGVGQTSPTALTLRNEAEFGVPGTSIEFWSFDNEDNQPYGIFKKSYIISNPYYYPGLTFGNQTGIFKFNTFDKSYQYTGSIVTGSENQPIGTTLFEINAGSSEVLLGSGMNLTMGTNGVLIAPAVFNTQTATYTLQLSDNGKTIEMNSGSANNLIVPAYASVPFPIGTTINGIQLGVGQTTVSGSSGVFIRSAGGRTKTTLQYSGFTLVNRATNEWHLVGDLTA